MLRAFSPAFVSRSVRCWQPCSTSARRHSKHRDSRPPAARGLRLHLSHKSETGLLTTMPLGRNCFSLELKICRGRVVSCPILLGGLPTYLYLVRARPRAVARAGNRTCDRLLRTRMRMGEARAYPVAFLDRQPGPILDVENHGRKGGALVPDLQAPADASSQQEAATIELRQARAPDQSNALMDHAITLASLAKSDGL